MEECSETSGPYKVYYTLCPYQVVEWDETHQHRVIMCGVGRSAMGKETQVRFHRMPDGTVDTIGGQQEDSTLVEKRN